MLRGLSVGEQQSHAQLRCAALGAGFHSGAFLGAGQARQMGQQRYPLADQGLRRQVQGKAHGQAHFGRRCACRSVARRQSSRVR